MKEASKIDMGSIKVHKKVVAEIVASALSDVGGVSLVKQGLTGWLVSFVGEKANPGISVYVDKNNQVIVEVKILIRYGLNIPETARQVQDTVRQAIERTVDIDLKDVNVIIQGIERGEP
jgi:uncharacterized alkaline shock family protein YloU